MRKSLFLTLAITAAAVAATPQGARSASAPSIAYTFAETNPLATGNWVRISIGETGMYEISYDKLREMGFSDPSAVTVYGKERPVGPFNFNDYNGRREMEDVISPVRSIHSNNKLIFYGEGMARLDFMTLGSGSGKRGGYERTDKSLYSERSHYFLTDSHPGESVPKSEVSDKSAATDMEKGYTCVYHEQDITQGLAGTGQNFWGENLRAGRPLSFTITGKYAVPDEPCSVYGSVAILSGQSGNLIVSLNGAERSFTLGKDTSKFYTFQNVVSSTKMKVDRINNASAQLKFSVSGYNTSKALGLDYWTVTYPISLTYARTDLNFRQQAIAFLGQSGVWRHPLPSNSIAWDITDHRKPVELDSEGGYFYVDNGSLSLAKETIVFHPGHTLNQIDAEYARVANQDLHALQQQDIDMVIFTTDVLEPYAQSIAALHAEHDGQNVAVITATQAYNEFTSGNPDPMAMRSIVKMLYQNSGHRLKNALFLGPIYADFRGVTIKSERPEGLIAYQQIMNKFEEVVGPHMDYYGVVTDYVRSMDSLVSAPVSVGIGVLPISSTQEAELAVNKIREYLTREDFSGIVNETLSIGLGGDSSLHENQAIRWGQLVQSFPRAYTNSEFAHHNLWMDQVGSQTQAQVIDALKRGKMMSIYYGHANSTSIGGITMTDALNLDVEEPAFIFMAACELAAPDMGHHGVGDIGVIRNPKGFAGSIFATRQVLSNANDALARNFANAMFVDNEKNPRTESPTVGEVYAMAKDLTSNYSEASYILVGDPSLTLPVALRGMEVTTDSHSLTPGETLTVSGRMLDGNGTFDPSFNGYVTVKLFEPVRTVPKITRINDKGEEVTVREEVEYNDLRLTSVKGKVKDGVFSVNLTIPATVTTLQKAGGDLTLPILVGAYNPATRNACSGRSSMLLAAAGTQPAPEAEFDDAAPVLSLSYDNDMRQINVEATDNVALLPGIGAGTGITLIVDGQKIDVPSGMSEGATANFWSGAASVARLADGKHTAQAVASDVNGNTSKSVNLTFEVTTPGPLTLTASGNVAIDNVLLTLSGLGSRSGNLIVCDRNGKVALNTEMSGTTYELDTTGLEPGTYRAAVRCNSAIGAVLNSNWVEFTVID